MTQVPPGWYRDPSPQNYDGHGLRYWDGSAWTEQVHHPAQQTAPQYYPPQYYQGVNAPTTPDGAQLASWGSRLAAQLIDGLILTPLMLGAAAPIVASQWDDISSWFDRATNPDRAAASPFGTSTDLPAIFDPFSGSGLALLAAVLAVNALYTVGFLCWKQATPGKMALGLRVRLRDSPDLPLSAVLLRWGFVTALSALARIPILGILASVASLLDYLWPLWDGKKQALHDKVARTNVVKVR